MIKGLFVISGKDERSNLVLFKDKFLCSEEEIPEELCLLKDNDLEKKVLELIKNDKECKLVFGPQKALFFADLNNHNKRLKDLPCHKIIKCSIFGVDTKYFIDKAWHFTIISIILVIIIGAMGIYMGAEPYYMIIFGIPLFLINCYKVKILEKVYYKKFLKKFKS